METLDPGLTAPDERSTLAVRGARGREANSEWKLALAIAVMLAGFGGWVCLHA